MSLTAQIEFLEVLRHLFKESRAHPELRERVTAEPSGFMGRSEEQERLCSISGNEASEDPLVVFLYMLMRDTVPTGCVGELVAKSETPGDTSFTNGYLAQYAKYLAERLRTR